MSCLLYSCTLLTFSSYKNARLPTLSLSNLPILTTFLIIFVFRLYCSAKQLAFCYYSVLFFYHTSFISDKFLNNLVYPWFEFGICSVGGFQKYSKGWDLKHPQKNARYAHHYSTLEWLFCQPNFSLTEKDWTVKVVFKKNNINVHFSYSV